MWCIVWYINLPPTLCRSKQTLRLLFVVLPQQYFYLSCETAIQIDEVQQHDIFCTSITLQGWATWVKSQQTITFPDISSPHSDRWWILPDKAFIIAENRECTKISSLFFSPPSSASLSKSRWTQLQKENGLHTHTPSEGKSVESLQDIHWQSKSISLLQGSHYGAVGRGAYQMETTVLCQLRFDPATMKSLLWKWATMRCHWRLAPFYHLSQSSVHWSSVVQDASSHHTWQAVPQPHRPTPHKPSGRV